MSPPSVALQYPSVDSEIQYLPLKQKSKTGSKGSTTANSFEKIPVSETTTQAYARRLDGQDPLRHLRSKYIIPTKAGLMATSIPDATRPSAAVQNDNDDDDNSDDEAIYFCGNSLGLQPRQTADYVATHLATWSTLGVYGHFTSLTGSTTTGAAWQDLAACAAKRLVPLVGARDALEVVAMNTLTVNLHLAMAAFYRPAGRRIKILLERKAFPSDHYAVESQARWWGLDPEEVMVLAGPEQNTNGDDVTIETNTILRVLEEQGEEIAVVLLPGVQYYTGQMFEMEKITRVARAKGCVVGWDLAHAVGNVELRLHDWDVDFAVWCHYKYLNAGPGAIAGMFVHEKHGRVERVLDDQQVQNGTVNGHDEADKHRTTLKYMPRLMGWYGGDKSSRFRMDNKFVPIPGAGGFQVSNPSALDLTSLIAALDVFAQTNIESLRRKSLQLTAYLQFLLLQNDDGNEQMFQIITPLDPNMRGAQLSLLLLKQGCLKQVGAALKEAGIVVDQREPNVIRVAPVPMYNTYTDVWRFVRDFKQALAKCGQEEK